MFGAHMFSEIFVHTKKSKYILKSIQGQPSVENLHIFNVFVYQHEDINATVINMFRKMFRSESLSERIQEGLNYWLN